MPIRVAIAQMDPQLAQNALNLKRVLALFHEAVENGAQLVVFPECAISGYGFADLESARAAAEPLTGPTTVALSAACAATGAYTVVGLLECADPEVYNVAALIGPEGVIGVYRKIHLPYLGVDRFATPGDRPFKVWETPLGRIGIAICYDLRFPEALRVLGVLGADIIVLPTNWPETSELMPDYVTRTRALENRVYLLACNRVGVESGFRFFGRSQIVGTSGKVYVETGDQPEIAYADIEPALAREKRIIIRPREMELDTFGDRRPEFYGELAQGQ